MHNPDLLDNWLHNFHQGSKPKWFLKKGSWLHLTNEKASRKEQKSHGGFTFKPFEWRSFMAISWRLRLCWKLTGRLNCVGIKKRIDLLARMSRSFICLIWQAINACNHPRRRNHLQDTKGKEFWRDTPGALHLVIVTRSYCSATQPLDQ